MKQQIFALILGFLVVPFTIEAQCTTAVSGFGNNTVQPMYNVSGTVTMTLNLTMTELTLNLGEDFTTAAGPDVRAYWVAPGDLTDQQLATSKVADLTRIPIGIIASNEVSPNGAKTLKASVPFGTPINEYTKLFFYCEAFDVFWDVGSLEPINPLICTGIDLSTKDFEIIQEISVFPNPAKDYFTITLENGISIDFVEIYTMQGQLVQISNTSNVKVQGLPKGLYLLKVQTNKGIASTKIMKE